MDTKIKINAAKLPKLLADLTHSNQFLKFFALVALGISALALLLSLVLGTRAPIVLTLSPSAERLEQRPWPKAEDEIKAAALAYIERRYKWEPTTVERKLFEAEAFVFPNALKAYRASIINVVRFSKEKLVAQKAYPEQMSVNLEKRTVSVLGERVTSIQGIKAAGDLKLELTFESGPRTQENPWGIYISKEKEE